MANLNPLDKLVDTISKAVGIVYKPRAIRKEADATAYATEVTAKANAKALEIEQKAKEDILDMVQERKYLREIIGQINSEFTTSNVDEVIKIAETDAQTLAIEQKAEEHRLERAQERILYKENQRQKNIEAVAVKAAEVLQIESHVSDEPVDKDWVVRLFNSVEDISNEKMQYLWGKILAGEVKRPKSFSLHTLEVIKNLSQAEAELFSKVANLFIYYDNSAIIYRSQKLEDYGLSFNARLILNELGLIQPDKIISLIFDNPEGGETIYYAGKYAIRSRRDPNLVAFQIPILSPTRAGIELSKLLTTVANSEYIREFCMFQKQYAMTVEYSSYYKLEGDIIESVLPWREFTSTFPD